MEEVWKYLLYFRHLDEICEARRTYDDFIHNTTIFLNYEVLHPTFTTLTCLGLGY